MCSLCLFWVARQSCDIASSSPGPTTHYYTAILGSFRNPPPPPPSISHSLFPFMHLVALQRRPDPKTARVVKFYTNPYSHKVVSQGCHRYSTSRLTTHSTHMIGSGGDSTVDTVAGKDHHLPYLIVQKPRRRGRVGGFTQTVSAPLLNSV